MAHGGIVAVVAEGATNRIAAELSSSEHTPHHCELLTFASEKKTSKYKAESAFLNLIFLGSVPPELIFNNLFWLYA